MQRLPAATHGLRMAYEGVLVPRGPEREDHWQQLCLRAGFREPARWRREHRRPFCAPRLAPEARRALQALATAAPEGLLHSAAEQPAPHGRDQPAAPGRARTSWRHGRLGQPLRPLQCAGLAPLRRGAARRGDGGGRHRSGRRATPEAAHERRGRLLAARALRGEPGPGPPALRRGARTPQQGRAGHGRLGQGAGGRSGSRRAAFALWPGRAQPPRGLRLRLAAEPRPT
mmetsp:Transcript_102386/g.330239  ORF Transcript_102386/g.330239 Transcript_102386/m.330239 type:complete len:229 (+) Transcript_102386:822-1508(+)